MQYTALRGLLFLAAAALPAAEYSTYIGDRNTWHISRLIVDASGNTYVAGGRTFNLGYYLHPDFATEAIVAKLDASGRTVAFAGIGGKGNDMARAVALDRAGNIYIAGSTTSPNFPLKRPLYTEGRGFIVKYNPDASEVLYSTYFPDRIEGMVVDPDGAMYVTGLTTSSDFPVTPGLPKGPVSGGAARLTYGAFLTKIAPLGDKIAYSTVISGQNKPCGAGSSCFTSSRGATSVGVAIDGAGNAYIAGNSDVIDLPTTIGVVTPSGAGAWVAKVNASGTALAYLTYLGTAAQTLPPFFTPATRVSALAVDAAGNAHLTGSTSDPKLPVGTFALKLNPAGSAFLWSASISADETTAATLDASGNLWVSGFKPAAGFPNTDGWSAGEDFVVRLDAAGSRSYSARYPGGSVRQTIAVDSLLHTATESGVVSAVAPSPRPMSRPWMVGPLGGQVAPGEIIAIFGPHIGPASQVFFDDIAAPVLYSGDEQLNTIVPFDVAGRKTVRVRVGTGGEFAAGVLPAIPQIFAPALNEDGTVNSSTNPARIGSVMTVWVTGSGYAEYMGYLYANGEQVKTLYSANGQINFVVPQATSLTLVSGDYYFSPPFEIWVRP